MNAAAGLAGLANAAGNALFEALDQHSRDNR